MCQNVSEFIDNNRNLSVVKEIIQANETKDRKNFSRVLKEIRLHLNAVEILKESDWCDCEGNEGCADCRMWKNMYRDRLIIGAK